MTTTIKYGLLLLLATMSLTAAAQTAAIKPVPPAAEDQLLPASVRLNLTVSNIKHAGKPIYVGFYKKTDVFPLQGFQSHMHVFTPSQAGTVTIAINDLPPGEYAIALFQDINGSGDMDLSATGFPKEPCGVLNQKPNDYSEPSFEQSKIDLWTATTDATIQMINHFPFMQKVSRFFTAALVGI
jgi:uncharacterized protein (DUF2141 family)